MQTELFSVIGHPIGHTMSPFLHERLFALAGKTGGYVARDVPPGELAAAVQRLRGVSGFNVTLPHKRAIIPFLDSLSETAALYGSVNTVSAEGGLLVGHTTDGEGFTGALRCAGVPLAGRVLLLGAGGVARVMAFEAILNAARIPLELTIAARSLKKAASLCDECAALAAARGLSPSLRGCSFSELEQVAPRERWELLCNGTPVGMFPSAEAAPVSEAVVAACGAVFDAVYNPDATMLLRMAEAQGKQTVHGMDMLVWQAAAAQRIWFGARFMAGDLAALSQAAVLEMSRRFSR